MRNDSIVRRVLVGDSVDVAQADDVDDVDAAHELVENIASIAALPLDVLPAGPARDALFALAEAGHDVSVYQPMAIELGNTYRNRWTIWVRPEYPWMEGRYSPQEWQAAYAGELARILGSTEVAR